MLIHTTELVQPGFGKAPEAFDAIDMGSAPDKFILPMIDSQVLAITDIDQAVVTAPAIGIDDAIQSNTAPDDPLERCFTAVRDDFCVDTPVAFEYTKDSCFAEGPATAFAFDTLGTEIRFIDLDLASEWRLKLAILCNAYTDASQIPVDGVAVNPRQRSDLGGVYVQCKQPDNLPKLALTD